MSAKVRKSARTAARVIWEGLVIYGYVQTGQGLQAYYADHARAARRP